MFACIFETLPCVQTDRERTDCNFRLFSMTFRVRAELLPEITVFPTLARFPAMIYRYCFKPIFLTFAF